MHFCEDKGKSIQQSMLDPVVLAQLAELDFQNGAIRMGGSAVGPYIRWRGSVPRVRGSGHRGAQVCRTPAHEQIPSQMRRLPHWGGPYSGEK